MNRDINENEIFIFQQCGLSISEASALCCVSISTVEDWFKGKRIPPLCKRVMSLYSGRDLELSGWRGWSIRPNRLVMPSGDSVSPRQIEKWFTLYGESYRRYQSPVRAHLAKRRFIV